MVTSVVESNLTSSGPQHQPRLDARLKGCTVATVIGTRSVSMPSLAKPYVVSRCRRERLPILRTLPAWRLDRAAAGGTVPEVTAVTGRCRRTCGTTSGTASLRRPAQSLAAGECSAFNVPGLGSGTTVCGCVLWLSALTERIRYGLSRIHPCAAPKRFS
jgi:hypothetical protein